MPFPARRTALFTLLALASSAALAADGLLDPTFSVDGRQMVGFAHPPNDSDFARAVAAQADGALVLAGQSSSGTETFASVARLLPGGLLDTGFADDGRLSFRFAEDGGQSIAHQVLIRPAASGGGIVLVGEHWDGEAGSELRFGLALLTPDGDFDPAFGASLTPGRIAHSIPGGDLGGVAAAALTSTGKILVGGYGVQTGQSDVDGFVARFTVEGALDGSFSGDGVAWVAVDLGGDHGDRIDGLAVQPDGKIVTVGAVTRAGDDLDTAIVRFLASGALDPAFDGAENGNGVVIFQLTDILGLALDRPSSVVVQPDGRLLFGGGTLDFDDARFRGFFGRLLPDGSTDPTLAAELVPDDVYMSSTDTLLDLQSDGKILFTTRGADDCTVRRYDAGGDELDPSFGGDGVVTVAGTTGVPVTCAASTLAGGRLVLAGLASASDDEFFVARLQSALLFRDGFESASSGEWGE